MEGEREGKDRGEYMDIKEIVRILLKKVMEEWGLSPSFAKGPHGSLLYPQIDGLTAT